jgi:Zn-dependent protease with chaperone function
VRLNSANRSFFALLALVVLPYVLLGVLGCGLLSLVVYRLATDGLSGLHHPGEDLRPAAVFFGLVTTGTVVAVVSVVRQVRATRRLAKAIAADSLPLPSDVERTASRVGLRGRVDVWDDSRPCSFTYGLVAPRVVVSRGLADAVTGDELEAVLHHEHYHVRNRDTLKVVVARAAPSAFFFLPVLRALRDRYLAGRELAADRRAVRALGERPVAGALYKVLDSPSFAEFGAAAALGGGDFLGQRVEQLELGVEPRLEPLARAAIVATAAGLVGLTGALALTVANGGAGDMSMDRSMTSGGFGVATSVLGWVLCMCAWLVVGVVVATRARRHRRAA